jgi:hypothetical protein
VAAPAPSSDRAAQALRKTIDLTMTTRYLFCTSIVLAVIYDQLTQGIPSRLLVAEKPKGDFGLVRADKLSAHDESARAHGIEQVRAA